MGGIRRFSSRRQQLGRVFLAEKLRGAKSYRRIAGYFRSSIFELVGEEIADIPDVRIVCNSELDAADICPEPCSDPGEVVAMKTTDQNELVILSVGAFLRRHLTGAAELDGFLDHQLALDRSAVTVEIGAE